MGTIIHFNPRQRAAPPVASGDASPECEIVIFPGVRIEREETAYEVGTPGPEADGADRGHRPRKSN